MVFVAQTFFFCRPDVFSVAIAQNVKSFKHSSHSGPGLLFLSLRRFCFFVSATFCFCRCDGFATDLAFQPASQRQPASWPASWLVCWRCGGLVGWPSGRLDNHLAARSLIRWRWAAPIAWPVGQPTSCSPPPHAPTQTAQVLVGLETLVSYVQ